MAFMIPWQNAPEFQFEISLDGTVYVLRMQWNNTAGSWAMDVYSREMLPLSLGARLVFGVPVPHGPANLMPPGIFVPFGEEPNYQNMIDGTARLIYLSGAEVDAL